MSNSNTNVSSLSFQFQFPEDRVFEILWRLPVESLTRFTIVCKAWHALIKKPDFISKHFSLSKLNPNHNYMVYYYNCDTHEPSMSLYYDEPIRKPIDFGGIINKMGDYEIVGVSNGLICIRFFNFKFGLVVCNPSTRRINRIKYCDFLIGKLVDGKNGGRHICTTAGFSCDPNSGDYKLIHLVRYYDADKLFEKAWVYTMSTDTWREIDIQPLTDIWFCEPSASALINGVFYWKCEKQLGWQSFYPAILSFDMSNESFRVIPFPLYVWKPQRELEWELTHVKDQLAVFVFTRYRGFHVWMLDHDSMIWSRKFKVMTLPVIARPMPGGEVGYVKLVGHGRNNDVIYEDRASDDVKLFLYNFETGEIKGLPFGQLGWRCKCQVYSYSESLVPVKKREQI